LVHCYFFISVISQLLHLIHLGFTLDLVESLLIAML